MGSRRTTVHFCTVVENRCDFVTNRFRLERTAAFVWELGWLILLRPRRPNSFEVVNCFLLCAGEKLPNQKKEARILIGSPKRNGTSQAMHQSGKSYFSSPALKGTDGMTDGARRLCFNARTKRLHLIFSDSYVWEDFFDM